MSVIFDPSPDFELVCDGLVEITLTQVSATANDDGTVTETRTPVVIEKALSRSIRQQEIEASEGRYQAGDVKWHWDITRSPRPRKGDEILESAAPNRKWVVFEEPSVDEQTLRVRYRVFTREA